MLHRRHLFTVILTLALSGFVVKGCGVYSFGGANTEGIDTYTVEFFENIAAMVYPTLAQNFTEGMKERIRTQSRLSQVNQDGDVVFEGVITNYTISSAGVEANTNMAALNRLSITVRVKYTNHKDTSGESDFEESFTQFKEFRGDVSAQEEQLTRDIIQMLTEDIFNRAFSNW